MCRKGEERESGGATCIKMHFYVPGPPQGVLHPLLSSTQAGASEELAPSTGICQGKEAR